ncbi:MAG TPA: ATP-binding protein [Jatrophihabitans sp.]
MAEQALLDREDPEDAARYRLVLSGTIGVCLLIFAFGSALQSAVLDIGGKNIPVWHRLFANFVALALIVPGAWMLPIRTMSWRMRVPSLALLLIVGITARIGVERALGIHADGKLLPVPADTLPAAVAGIIGIIFGVAQAGYQDRLTQQARANARHALVAASALEALRAEERRVRREVADGLHGTLQQQLVLLSTRLRHTIDSLPPAEPSSATTAADLTWVKDELDRLRERDVRDMSRMLYPSGLDLGLSQASRMMLQRIPASIQVSARIDESVIAADDHSTGGIPFDLRLLATRVLEEGVANALKHGAANRLGVLLRVDEGDVLHIVVDDDGVGTSPSATESGLRLLRERLREHGGGLNLDSGPLGGLRLSADLPLTFGPEVPIGLSVST